MQSIRIRTPVMESIQTDHPLSHPLLSAASNDRATRATRRIDTSPHAPDGRRAQAPPHRRMDASYGSGTRHVRTATTDPRVEPFPEHRGGLWRTGTPDDPRRGTRDRPGRVSQSSFRSPQSLPSTPGSVLALLYIRRSGQEERIWPQIKHLLQSRLDSRAGLDKMEAFPSGTRQRRRRRRSEP